MNPAILAAFPFIADVVSRGVSGKGLSENVVGMMNGGNGGSGVADTAIPDAATVPMGQVQQQELPAPEQAPMYDAAMSPEMKRQFAVQQMQQRGVPMTTANLDMMLQHLSSQAPQNTEQSILANVPGIDIPANAYGSVANEIAAEQQAAKGGANQVTMKPGEAKNMPLKNSEASATPTPPAPVTPSNMVAVQDFGTDPKASKIPPKNPMSTTPTEDYSSVNTTTPKNALGVPKMFDRSPIKSDGSHNKDAFDPLKAAGEAGMLGRKGEPPTEVKDTLKVRNLVASLKNMSPQERAPYMAKLQQLDPKTFDKVRMGLSG